MNSNKKRLIIGLCIFVGIMIFALMGYNILSDNFNQPDSGKSNPTTDSSSNSTQKASDFVVFDGDGKEIKLSDYLGKPVVINFWATWCGYCVEEMPDFNNAYKKYPDVQFLMINATDGKRETVEVAQRFIKENSFEFPVFFDKNSEAISTYNAYSLPTTLFITKDGNIQNSYKGMINPKSLEKEIEKLLK